MRKGQGAFEYILLMAGILMIALVAFFMLRGTNQTSVNQAAFAQCATKMVVASACYDEHQNWKANDPTKYKTADYALPIDCNKDIGGGFAGTPWDVNGTDDEFVCGPKQPQ
ncbi:MAG: class III signal peptide-containing protein [Candidatus Micrarchaeota archaeon]